MIKTASIYPPEAYSFDNLTYSIFFSRSIN